MKVKQLIYYAIMPIVKLYWRIFRPQSYGVKIVITHPRDPDKVLLIRHSYGNAALWNIPGGGYNPKKETAKSAIEREVREELGVSVLELEHLGEYCTEGEGKRDTVTLFSGTIKSPEEIKTNSEVSKIDWVEMHTLNNRSYTVARAARQAVAKMIETSSQ